MQHFPLAHQDTKWITIVVNFNMVYGPIMSISNLQIMLVVGLDQNLSHLINNYKSRSLLLMSFKFEWRCKRYKKSKTKLSFSLRDHIGPPK